MDITPEARERLDHFMNSRRLELGISWREVATRAGISYEALRALRVGPGGTADLTARKIDSALEWAPGSVARIAAGGDLREQVPASVTEHLAQVFREIEQQDDGDDVPVLTEEEMRILATFVKMIRTRKAERERGEGKRGA